MTGFKLHNALQPPLLPPPLLQPPLISSSDTSTSLFCSHLISSPSPFKTLGSPPGSLQFHLFRHRRLKEIDQYAPLQKTQTWVLHPWWTNYIHIYKMYSSVNHMFQMSLAKTDPEEWKSNCCHPAGKKVSVDRLHLLDPLLLFIWEFAECGNSLVEDWH